MTQTEPRTSEGGVAAAPTGTRWRSLLILLAFIVLIGFLAFRIEIAFPATPSVNKTFTPMTQSAPQEVGSFDVLGKAINKDEATRLVQTDEGQKQLSPENGAVAVTEDLLTLGRKAFYSETFGNEVFQTDVVGALDGPINPVTMTKAICLQQRLRYRTAWG